MVLWSSLEMGDEEVIAATRRTIDARYGEGIADSMTWSGRNTVRDMVTKGLPDAWATGPILADAKYPEAIVARAVTDGTALNLVLHPGAEPCRTELGFARLVPGKSYRLKQADALIVAGADGTARATVALDGRTELDLVPVG